MLRDPGFMKDITDADMRKNYEEQANSTEEESLATLKGSMNINEWLGMF